MAPELRNTGISVVGDVPWGTHFCHFYETKQDLLDTLIPYFKAGLERREFCLWVVSDAELLTVEQAKEALAQAVPNLDRHLADENIEIVGSHDWYFEQHALNLERAKHGWDAKLKRALARGFEGLRVSADTFWLAKRDWKDFFAYEKQVNDWITNQSMTVMCTYPLAKSGATEVLDVVQAHQFAIARRHGEWEVIETPELIQAKAEIRILNEQLEQRVIERTRELAAANEELKREIAERQQAEEALRGSENRLRLVLETLPVGVAVTNRAGDIVLINAASKRIWGGTIAGGRERREQTKGYWHDSGQRIDPESWASVRALSKGETSLNELIDIETYDGQRKIIRNSAAPVRDSEGLIVGAVIVNEDVTNRVRAEEKLKETSEQLRKLSASLQSAIEEERIRIARELHDELGSALAVLKWGLEEISGLSLAMPTEEIENMREKLATLTTLIDTTFAAVRRISSELRPGVLDEAGLVAAIEWAAKQFEARTEIICQFESSVENFNLSRERSTAVFRIFQEALTNILRHAGATRVGITMKDEGGEFVLTISDNGSQHSSNQGQRLWASSECENAPIS